LLACSQMDLQVDLQVDDVVMIGDGEADVQAAQRAGCVGIGVTHSFSAEELKEAGAEYCFASLDEVLPWLQNKLG